MFALILDGIKDILGPEGYAATAEIVTKYGAYIFLALLIIAAWYFLFYKPSKDLKKIIAAQVQKAWESYKPGEAELSSEEKLDKLVERIIATTTKKIEDPTFKLRFKKLVLYLLNTENVKKKIGKLIKYEYGKLISE